MQELRKQNERLQREVEDLPTIIQKYEAAQSRVEDLNVQLQRKSEIEMYVSKYFFFIVIILKSINYIISSFFSPFPSSVNRPQGPSRPTTLPPVFFVRCLCSPI